MVLFENPRFVVSQGFFSGWKVRCKLTGAIFIPDRDLATQVGLVWMLVRKTNKSASLSSDMSEEVMFGSFARAVSEPLGEAGQNWKSMRADDLADLFIEDGNGLIRDPLRFSPKSLDW